MIYVCFVDEAESFNHEWQTRTRSATAIGSSNPNANMIQNLRPLALPSTSESSTRFVHLA